MTEPSPAILQAIEHAVVAGHCRKVARTNSVAASGLNRAADQHSNRAAALLEEVCRCV